MKEEKKSVKHVGLTFCQVLTLIFITLKLVGIINWSWLLVLLPLIAEFGVGIIIIAIILIIGGFTALNKWR